MDDTQLSSLLGNLQTLSDQLAQANRFIDAAVIAGAIQAIRALRTRLEPAEPKPALSVVPAEPHTAEG